MLDDLDTIDWAQLVHAFGPASDIPERIRALISPDPDARQAAIEGLFETICHQETVYEASAPAVPFLQELLADADTPDKMLIANMLAAMADGKSDMEVALGSPAMETLLRKGLAQEGRDFDTELAEGRRLVEQTRAAVGKELPLLYPYLACEEPEVRRAVASAMKNYPERASETRPLLERACDSETDAAAKEAMEEAIQLLRGNRA